MKVLYSLYGCVGCVLQDQTQSLRLKTILEFGKRGTRLAMLKTNLRVKLLVIEPGSGATEGVLD